ncbi:MAG: TonB-dependent receptor [Muribaculaceae bacterium]|nr:TonB-dependent receptor [Muribaculaceae bacterium]
MKKFILIGICFWTLSSVASTIAEVSDTVSLSEVTVTAIKQGADLRTQATALTIVGMEESERNQVQSVKTASDLVPNLFIPDYGSRMTSTVYMRGIGTRIDQPAVGLTIDNVPVMTKENYDIDLTDIARVETLRGPQNTLYGRNTLGGVMNVYTLSPLNYQGTRAIAEGASHGTWRLGASHYRLLSQDLGLSLSAQYSSSEGEFTNEYNGKRCDWERMFNTRAKIEWRSQNGWYLSNVASLAVSRQGGYPYEWVQTGEIAYNDTCFYRRTSVMDGLTLRKDLSRFTLSSITSYQYIDDNMTLDQDFTTHDYFTLTQARREHAITQDFIARSHPSGNYSWLAGLSGFYRRYNMDAPVTFKDYGIDQLIESHVNSAIPDYPIAWDTRSFVLGSHFTSPSWGAALYHGSTYQIGQWTLQAGVRIDYEHARLNYHSFTHTGYDVFNLATGTLFAHEPIDIDEHGTLDKDFFEILPNVSLTWQPWEGKHHTVYLAASRGSKAGGFNTQMFSDVLQQRLMGLMGIGLQYDVDKMVGYDPEKAWNYEIGGHFECWDGRVQSDMDVFFMDCRDRQLTVFPPGTTTGRMMTNAGKTHSWGGEFAMTVAPTERTHLNVSYGFTRATFKDYNDGRNDYEGKRVPYAPMHTLFAEASHGISIAGNSERLLIFAANVRAAGDIYWDEANTKSLRQPLYALLGASVTWQQPRYSLQLWGRNLTDTSYNTFFFVSIQHPFLQRGHGRQLGITLRLNLATNQ